MSKIVVIIPAAGSSSRMGRPKQLLQWKKTTLLGHAIETSKALPVFKTVLVLGANYDLIYGGIKKYGIDILENKDWNFGLGNSIASGVSYVLRNEPDCDGILIMLPDQPLITADYLNSILETFTTGKGQIIASSYDNGKHGVPVLFDKSYFKELATLNDDKGAKSILQKNSENVLGLDAGGKIVDIDTVEIYERLYNAHN